MAEKNVPHILQYGLYDRMLVEMRERSVVTTRCAWCPWTTSGEFQETREAFTAHREQEHPFVRLVLPNPRARSVTYEMRAAA